MEILNKTLYIVATPIGNLDDITFRAIDVLKQVDIIACEDKRITVRILKKYDIPNKELISHHKHNKLKSIPKIIEKLNSGKSVAYLSDAGTPGISDPGNFLIEKVIEENISVVPIPGVSSLTTLISVSDIPTNQFHFEGFLPHKKGRHTRLLEMANLKEPIIVLESTHRIIKFLNEVLEYCGNRNIIVGRELTKYYETIFRGNVSNSIEYFTKNSTKGEFTILISDKMGQ
ncbi:MAG: 16S rRNA (cytidine(1402)-2'-O)-methyltransferase [Candidatus Marinimicrobia bacterium]|nr:16S rRNA (cytidine(1402)-2'-O)-methyltransferase [Candidatus Neomarinimicrobiota bacterium]